MLATRHLAVSVSALFVATALTVSGAPAQNTDNSGKLRLTAFAVDLNHPGRPATTRVTIIINRWTPDAERDRLVAVLREKGPDGLLEALQKEPPVGSISTTGSVAYDLRYARQLPTEDGGRRIVLATDRPISFYEAQNQPRSFDYRFTLLELRLDRNGHGEGKMQVAVRPTLKDNVLVLEDYEIQPVMLTDVRLER
jgi:hypothetical protein